MATIGPHLLREKNQRSVLKTLRQNPGISRKEIADKTGLGKNTISLIIDDLINDQVIYESHNRSVNQAGRPSVSLKFTRQGMLVAGIVVETQQISVTIYNYGLEAMETYQVGFDDVHLVASLKQIISDLMQKYDQIFGISIAVPGIIGADGQTIIKSNYFGWKNLDVLIELHQIFDGLLVINNTVKAMALLSLEETYPKVKSMFFLNLGNGVGGAFINQHEVLVGDDGHAGEIGQIPVSLIDVKADATTIEQYYRQQKQLLPTDTKVADRLASLTITLDRLIQYSFDPEQVVVHGAVTTNPEFQQAIENSDSHVQIVEQNIDLCRATALTLINKYELELFF
ncbi:ROK family protein [Paucilactobacillus sp. N302-9]